MAKVKIPQPLRKLSEGKDEVTVEGESVEKVLESLEEKYPQIRERIRDEGGKLRRFINIFVNGNDIRHLQAEETPVKEDDEVSILPAIAGG